MKTIQQLLQLSKNPFYKFTSEEKEVLDDFLSKKRGSRWEKSQDKNSKKLSPPTRVTARNIVEKVDTYAPDERTVRRNDTEDENDTYIVL